MEQIAEKSWQIANRLPAMADAAREVFDWLAGQPLPSRVKYSVGLAIEELATNMIKYGYDDDAEHLIRFTISVHPDHLKIVFEDDGHPFDPTAHPAPDIEKIVNSRKTGGLGIELVRRICEKMVYRREGALNRLVLHIRRHDAHDTQPIPTL